LWIQQGIFHLAGGTQFAKPWQTTRFMRGLVDKVMLLLNRVEFKIAHANGNLRAEHRAMESMAILRTRLRVVKEQEVNRALA
jgi:hypothetical protein